MPDPAETETAQRRAAGPAMFDRLVEANLAQVQSNVEFMSGATVKAAKKPSTTVGTPASISSKGFRMPRDRGVAYSAM